ncbi:hypothetical protein CB1_012719019 [Camelus ferus]|nr:hypothetical protein CB1_012719019 [Camelus ferus]
MLESGRLDFFSGHHTGTSPQHENEVTDRSSVGNNCGDCPIPPTLVTRCMLKPGKGLQVLADSKDHRHCNTQQLVGSEHSPVTQSGGERLAAEMENSILGRRAGEP